MVHTFILDNSRNLHLTNITGRYTVLITAGPKLPKHLSCVQSEDYSYAGIDVTCFIFL